MTARVIQAFSFRHNELEAAEQEYELAKEHFRQVCSHRQPTNAEHQARFHDAVERQAAARERYLRAICE